MRDHTNPLHDLDPDEVVDRWGQRELDVCTDAELVAHAVELLSVPHHEPADSFALHAPLELMARAELLGSVSPEIRTQARQRIAWVACTWANQGTPIDEPSRRATGDPIDALRDALRTGDGGLADQALLTLTRTATQDEIAGELTNLVLAHLGGAAHAPIFLELLPRLRSGAAHPLLMARTLLGDLTRHPDWTLGWIDQPRLPHSGEITLTERLVAPPSPGDPGSNFIQPVMSLVDRTGLATELLADVTVGLSVTEARRELLRVAAHSMLQDDPASSPYGWTHCLTMPQAALAIAGDDPQRFIDVAATYVLGFRSTQSTCALAVDWEPEPPPAHRGVGVLIEHGAADAAALMWHATDQRGFVRQLVDHAAIHEDAHLAKYTLACIDAAGHDPEAAQLYLAAAASLGGWWYEHDDQPALDDD